MAEKELMTFLAYLPILFIIGIPVWLVVSAILKRPTDRLEVEREIARQKKQLQLKEEAARRHRQEKEASN